MENSESPITLSSGQVVAVWTVSGVVADDQHSNSTRVYSSGGGGFVGPNGGHVSAPEVHSETTTRQSVWITDGASKDHQISLRNMSIPIRVGQRVTARFVMPVGAREWRLESFTNHSADLFYSWASENTPPINLMSTDRGSFLATTFFVGGAASCWYAWRQLSGPLSSSSAWWSLYVGLLLLGGLAAFTGVMMRAARRSRLRSTLHTEYIEALHGIS